jgi:DNA-binding transcriptional LysR family regulator
MPLNFRQLEVMRAVCRDGSVTAAASALSISQPAVSMILRDCARIAGFPLFVRKHGRLQPTSETQGLLTELNRVFEGIERVGRLVDEMRDTRQGTVRVVATPTLADNLLPAAVAAFQRSHPGVQITAHAKDNITAIGMVTQELVDFALVLTPLSQLDARLVELCETELICVVAPGHPLAGRQEVVPQDLAACKLISFSRTLPLGMLVEQSFRDAGVPRRIAIEVNQSSLALALARSGVGVAVIDPFLLMDRRDHGVVRLRLRPVARVGAQALLPRDVTLSRAALLFLGTIRKTADALKRSGVL